MRAAQERLGEVASIRMRWVVLAVVAAIGCGEGGRYTGFVAASDVGIFASLHTTECECSNEHPGFGECASWSDEEDPCSCAPCAGVITLRLPGETVEWPTRDYARSHYSFWRVHGAAPGDELVYEFDGCHGSFSATVTVPEPGSLAIDGVQESGGETRVRWSPSGTDAAIVDVGGALAGVICFGPDTGEVVVPSPYSANLYVGVRTLRTVGTVHEANATLDVFQAAEIPYQAR